jgi:hypothetical protein
MIYKILVNEPYWNAWKIYKWFKGIWGVTLRASEVDLAILEKRLLEVDIIKPSWKKYVIMPKEVRKYANKHRSFFKKQGKKLYVIPYTIMTEI